MAPTPTPLRDLDLRPTDPPAFRAALVWREFADEMSLRGDSAVARLGILERVVLVLLDVAQLAIWEVAELLGMGVEEVVATHTSARLRVGLPAPTTPTCSRWDLVRAAHRIDDAGVIAELLDHVEHCPDCGAGAAEHRRTRRWWAARSATITAAPASGVFAVIPAFAAAVATAAALAAVAVVVDAAVSTPPAPPVPVVVDDEPGLPTDAGPPEGWPAPAPVPGVQRVEESPDVEADDAPPADDPLQDVTDTVDDLTDGTSEDLVDTIDETVDDVTDTLDDTVDDVTDTVDDLVDVPLDDGGLLP